jgi:hypothetical protein
MRDASSSYDGLADGIDEMLRGSGGPSAASGGASRGGARGSGRAARGILLAGGSGSGGRKRVHWPDQMEEDEPAEAGFRIGAESRQVCCLRVLQLFVVSQNAQGDCGSEEIWNLSTCVVGTGAEFSRYSEAVDCFPRGFQLGPAGVFKWHH